MARSRTRLPSRGRLLRRAAASALVPLGLLGGYLAGRFLRGAAVSPLPPALQGTADVLALPFGRLSYYRASSVEAAPLLLIHSINAAASAYEMKPLFDHYRRTRTVYAVDLPGFGLSDRPDRIYTPRLMTDAILALIEEIRRKHGPFPIDAIALSTASEFLARAAAERPTLFRTLALLSPTGFATTRHGGRGLTGSPQGRAALRDVLSFPLWSRSLFRVLVSRPSLRFFLAKAWGSADIDHGLLSYDYRSAHQPGAEHAPFSFIAGFLFSDDSMSLYEALPMPVLMGHGTRGGFTDYRRKSEVEGRPNWSVHVFDAGAMIHFEQLPAFLEAYGAFLDRVG